MNYRQCKHCCEEIYETTVEGSGRTQWIHRYTGSAYCATRELDSVGEPEETEVRAA